MATINKIPKCPPLRFPDFNDDWKKTTLGEIGDIRMCKRIFADQTNTESGVPFYKIGTIGKTADCYISLSLFEEYTKKYPYPRKGQILVTCAGTIGRCLIFDGVPSYFQDSNIVWIDNNQSVIANSFLFHILDNTNWSRLNTSTITRLYNDDLRNVSLALPSLAEQKKIADFLSLIDERIQSCSETIKELKTQKAGLLNQLFSQKLRFPDFNDEWTQTTLGEILSLAPQILIDKPCIKDIISVKLHGKGISRTSATTLNLGATQYYLRRAGQLIYGKQNFHNGAIALIPKEYDNGITSKDIPSFVFDTTKSSPKYVLAYLLRVKYYEATEIYTTGTGSKRLKEDSFFSLPISLPSLEEQKKIADFLSLIDERIEVEEQLLKKYEEQKKYLLRNMFV